jgi:hypothetical protein
VFGTCRQTRLSLARAAPGALISVVMQTGHSHFLATLQHPVVTSSIAHIAPPVCAAHPPWATNVASLQQQCMPCVACVTQLQELLLHSPTTMSVILMLWQHKQ